jgi:Fn3 associated
MVELRAAPAAPLRYTTDGSDPKLCGATYDGPFVVPPGTLVVLAVAEKHGIVSECHRLNIHWDGGASERLSGNECLINQSLRSL